MNILRLETAASTNSWVAANEASIESPALVYAYAQTAGRGQRGNSWESEPGKNITASLLIHPVDFDACKQFRISEAVALAITDYLRGKGVEAKVKWPNDIYVGDKKICGILVEHVVTGKYITRTIAGFGINVNQKVFKSDAPNPVSLTQLTQREYDLGKEILSVASCLEKRLRDFSVIDYHKEFLERLWRMDDCFHTFRDKIRNERIQAKIHSVAEEGLLTLMTPEGEKRQFAFKEVEFIL